MKKLAALTAASALAAALVSALSGCGGNPQSPLTSSEGPGDDGGAGGLFGGNDGSTGAFDAYIEQKQLAVKVVTLSCAGECATVQAVAVGGHPPYSYAWDDGTTNATRQVCPSSDSMFNVQATDTGTTGELAMGPQTASASVTVDVTACPEASIASCKPGMYNGNWYTTASDAGTSNQLSGPLSFDFTPPSGAGNTLVLTQSTTINWDLIGTIVAHFTGGLNCQTGAFKVEDPQAAFTVGGLPAGTCDVTFSGSLDSTGATLAGNYSLANCSDGSWSGTWTTMSQ
jgi:hypothetical protein